MTLNHIYCLHEIGGKRNQEDFIWPLNGNATAESKVIIVCDGVGGSENGETASKQLAESLADLLTNRTEQTLTSSSIEKFVNQAKASLVQEAQIRQLSTEMATTLALLVFTDAKAFIAWCGDSRVYHIRNGEILYKTEDHSLVNSLIKSGEITEEEASKHPRKNIILKAIKADSDPVDLDQHSIDDIQDGDYFMLCTDGLLENISGKDLSYVLTPGNTDHSDIVQYMRDKCKDNTRDNYSMYLLQVDNTTEPVQQIPVKKKRKPYVFILIVLLAGITATIAFMKMSPAKSGNPIISDSTYAKTTQPLVKTGDTLPEFEIVSSADTQVVKADGTPAKDKVDRNKKNPVKPDTTSATDSASKKHSN